MINPPYQQAFDLQYPIVPNLSNPGALPLPVYLYQSYRRKADNTIPKIWYIGDCEGFSGDKPDDRTGQATIDFK